MRTFFVHYGTFFVHVSTPPTTTRLLLGPLSIARGQKASLFHSPFRGNRGNMSKKYNKMCSTKNFKRVE